MKRGNSNFWIHSRSPVTREKGLRTVVTVLILIAAYACSMSDSRPEGILSKDEMAKVLTELYLKEARINTLHVSQDSAKKLLQYYRFKYTEQTGAPDSIVDASYRYYLSRPRDLGEIYDRIIDTLTLREQKTSVGVKEVE